MLMLDVCCGLGGASEGMRARGWEVITLDIDPSFDPDIVADVRSWEYHGRRPDLVWCSPPCTEFSRTILPWIKDPNPPDLSIALACRDLIRRIQPRYYVIENVKGALKWLIPHLGRPAYMCNPYYLWGHFPDISHIRVKSHKEKLTSSRVAERARIPFEISYGLAFAIESHLELWGELVTGAAPRSAIAGTKEGESKWLLL